MSAQLQQHLKALSTPDSLALLQRINRGIEKESLRISEEGRIAQSPHPVALGSALTHPSITTDYSEALLEFITPVDTGVESSLQTLSDIHRYVYSQLDGEILWSASMPCVVAGDDSIPVAQYGSSNVARMKTVYRYGLGHRYGRAMQVISGIHYNFSLPTDFWQREWQEAGTPGTLEDWVTSRYLGLIRNFHRYSWLLIYLFGASPALCASFLRGRDGHGLQSLEPEGKTLYLPHATALRMGDLGYSSVAQRDLRVCYNSLDNYVDALRHGIMQPRPEYSHIANGKNGDYQQLNTSLLQIENEFYSTIRPKRVTYSGETPLSALRRGGIEYVEVRCIDVSPFSPVGLDAEQIRFLDSFLLFCLLEDSPACDEAEQDRIQANLSAVVNRGREPGLTLMRRNDQCSLTQWADELLASIGQLADLLDTAHGGTAYRSALSAQQAKVDDPELTPSARVLRELRERNLPFFRWALAQSQHWAEYFRSEPLPAASRERFAREGAESLAAQRAIEESDDISFEQYLARFYAQYEAV
ncbi:glutamate--cysteine ligase [Parahaliea aestuarii]|uniref:glutamate--cysteine ligase n=1 Tax=Parahaliea aestuarii TaxID=1852021 RepID=UPI001FEBAC70|nr:glutamate--cysteine ligase [Parahaliea aestuarii]